jgi:hypothetical protein
MRVTQFLEKHNPTFYFNRVDSRPRVNPSQLEMKFRHYLVTLITERGRMVSFYSVEEAVREGPFLINVLECLICEAVCGDMTYREACEEIEGVLDFREWQSCRDTRDGLIDLFGREGFGELLAVTF